MNMKISITLSILFLSFSCAIAAPDTTRLNLTNRILAVESKLRKTNDSLQRELQYYRVKDDYYSAALSDQSTRFSVIVAWILGTTGLLTLAGYGFLLLRIKNTKNYIDQKSKEITENAEQALVNLRKEANQRDIDRLESMENFHFSNRNLYAINQQINTLAPEERSEMSVFFILGLMLAHIETIVELYNLSISSKKHFTNKESVINMINIAHDHSKNIAKKYPHIKENSREAIEGGPVEFFGAFGINSYIIDKLITKNKKEELNAPLYRLSFALKELEHS